MISILKCGERLDHVVWDYPDGAVGVRLDTSDLRFLYANSAPNRTERVYGCNTTLIARIRGPRDIMELILVVDALRRWDPTPLQLVLPCMPYARQDRACVAGEAHSLYAFASLINGLGFEKVITLDPHSDVTGAVIHRLTTIDQATITGRFDAFNARVQPDNPADKPLFVSPDAGANKKVSGIAGLYGHAEFVRADKLRDLSTGRIKETVVYGDAMAGRDCIILDDIADGAASFVPLAKVLKEKGAKRVELYVTHGMFSKGIDHLIGAGVDHIWTTDSFRTDLPIHDQLTVLPIEQTWSFVHM